MLDETSCCVFSPDDGERRFVVLQRHLGMGAFHTAIRIGGSLCEIEGSGKKERGASFVLLVISM